LAEIEVFPGPNPAHRIILNAVKNRDENNPDKLSSYAYTTYDKMVITIDTASLPPDTLSAVNDTLRSLRAFFRQKDLLIMETAVEKKFMAPDKSNERVLATKVSGLKDPMIVYLVSQIQSTSFYDEIIHIANRNYVNPISKGSIHKYFFNIEDTLYAPPLDTIFTISYRPKPSTNFDGLQGVINISTNKWAVVNVKAKPAKQENGIAIQIQQMYELINGEHWFPVQLNTNITFDGLQVSSGGETTRLVGIGKTYIKDIELNPELVKKAFSHVAIEVDPNAAFQKEKQWQSYRTDSLSYRDKETYQFMDSVGKEAKFDKKLAQLQTLLTGKISWGHFDLLLDKFVGYNAYEGFWAGVGVKTNRRFSEKFNLGAYYAYSFKSRQSKFGLDASALVYKPWELKAQAFYQADNVETGGVSFYLDNASLFDARAYRNYFINQMNYTKSVGGGISWRMFDYLQVYGSFRQEKIENNGTYFFQRPTDINPITDFRTSEFRLQFRYAYKEKYYDNGRMSLSMGTKYPVFWFNYSRSIPGLFKNDFAYQRFDFQLRESFYTKYFGQTSLDIRAGLLLGDVPLAKLFSAQGTYEFITLWAPASFGTMRPGEFMSDKYVSVFLSHNFGTLLFKGEKFKPEFELITNIGFGWLAHPEYHHNTSIKTMELGFFESGLMVNSLVRLTVFNLGVGGVYRYGPYSYPNFKDNFSIKFTLTMPINSDYGSVVD